MKRMRFTILMTLNLLAGCCDVPAFAGAQEAGTPSIDERFKRADRNGDGVLTPDEVPNAELFKRMDRNGDRKVTLEEARAAFSSTGAAAQRKGTPAGNAPPTAQMKSTLNISYAQPEGNRSNLTSLDVYSPRGTTGCPAMVFVHGGAWRAGDKAGAAGAKPAFFTSVGWVFVSINYRLLPAAPVATQAQDVANAVAWVAGNITEYGGDSREIYLMGHSAGAHLVSLVATDDRRLKETGGNLSLIKGVVELDTAALDIPKLMKTGRAFYEPMFGADPKGWADISPMNHVVKGKAIPPFLLVVADKNQMKLEQARSFAHALREAGARAEILEAPDKTHGTLNGDLGRLGDGPTKAIMNFLKSIQPAEKPAATAAGT
jgi:acetyl esterase/lipase